MYHNMSSHSNRNYLHADLFSACSEFQSVSSVAGHPVFFTNVVTDGMAKVVVLSYGPQHYHDPL